MILIQRFQESTQRQPMPVDGAKTHTRTRQEGDPSGFVATVTKVTTATKEGPTTDFAPTAGAVFPVLNISLSEDSFH
jgi:hypothetical protein